MRKCHGFLTVASIGIAALLLCGHAAAGVITYTDLYTLGRPPGISPAPGMVPQTARGGDVVGFGFAGNSGHAILWSPAMPSGVDLNPPGFVLSAANDAYGTQQVGSGTADLIAFHALLWNGNPNSAVDLNPTGFTESTANGTSGAQQVGYGLGPPTDLRSHALLWAGTAASAVDLHPSGFLSSVALGTDGTHQVGSAEFSRGIGHGVVWNGTASSAVDLNPSGFIESEALGTSGMQQVGDATPIGAMNTRRADAFLWYGSANSAVDLAPAGLTHSQATDTNGVKQVGWGYGTATGNMRHALLWSGSAASTIDLHSVLPATFSASEARTIIGNDVYGFALDTSDEMYHAIVWNVQNVPEPARISLMTFEAMALARRRKR